MILLSILLAIAAASTPLVLAALGELITEKSGVLNLGVEGLMLVGAAGGYAVGQMTGSLLIGLFAGACLGAFLCLFFSVFVVSLCANQVAAGLALSILGIGLSSLLGRSFIGVSSSVPKVILGFPAEPFFAVLSVFFVLLVTLFFKKTRWGLIVRAVGENPVSSDALGYSVVKVRYIATIVGGAFSGLAGGYVSLIYAPQWADQLVAGRGWIAIALVVFSVWKPPLILLGAYLFGGATYFQFYLQAKGSPLPTQLLDALPYILTIVVLVVMSSNRRLLKVSVPSSLGQSFHRDYSQ